MSDTKPKRRGRKPKKDKDIELNRENEAVSVSIDQDHQFRELKGKSVEKWYQLKPGTKYVKVLERTRFENGNVYTKYLGREKDMVQEVKLWKEQGLVRV